MIEVRNPATGQVLETVPAATSSTVAASVTRLRTTQHEWEAIGPKQRATWLRMLRDWLLDEATCLADVLRSETGKPRAEAEIEMPALAEAINYFAGNAARVVAPRRIRPSGPMSVPKRLSVSDRPYPVVGVITPWNFPLLTSGVDVVPALLAGAAVLLKPSEVTPLTALELERGWREIGAPPVFTAVTGTAETGQAVVGFVDYVQFTGSTNTGKRVAHRAIDSMTPYSLELGGKDPAIVLADADLDQAVAGIAWGGLFNSGQACISVERVYVEAPVYDEFVARLTGAVAALRQGTDDRGYRCDVGPMATPAQRDIVEGHVADAVAAGAKAVADGTATDGFFKPTVLTGVDHGMACTREETFGPTIPVMKVTDTDEAIRLANDSGYGLSATVWTGNRGRGEHIAARLQAGAVNINDSFANMLAMSLPQGGWKNSGVGVRFGGPHALRKYCHQQAITTPRIPMPKRLPLWYSYSACKRQVLRRVLEATSGRSLRRLRRG